MKSDTAHYGNFEGDTILQCAGCFTVTDEDIVSRSTNSNFNKSGGGVGGEARSSGAEDQPQL